MTSEEIHQEPSQAAVQDEQKPLVEPAAPATSKKRPRLDLTDATGDNRNRKRGKSMFGILLGTLNRAKIEDKERSASEAAKKRHLIEQRLQIKLKKETDSVRKAEEAKRDKTTANRKEEDLQLKDSIYKLRRTRLPLIANFLCTSDNVSSDETSSSNYNSLSAPPRSHPPPLYYLPAILTREQEAFITRRKAELQEAAEKEWHQFREERTVGIAEINDLRQRVADDEARRKTEKETETEKDDMEADRPPAPAETGDEENKDKDKPDAATTEPTAPSAAADMEVDSGAQREENKETSEHERKEEPTPMQPDDEDAVEY
ncbi:hypothetical protein F5887DRAFT_1104994 [Amanita rubescens]|nr:hypothetical protein F5887DRAFT_1104994 [Amanita rubescens]